MLGHHCSALSGSEVVYSRHLQVRALRKLGLVLRRVRLGLGFEDEAMKELGVVSTPAPRTPAVAARTPVPPATEQVLPAAEGPQSSVSAAVSQAIAVAVEAEELRSVKEEQLDMDSLERAADNLTLYPAEVVAGGLIEIESSSGSDSDSSESSTTSSSSAQDVAKGQHPYTEVVPAGHEFYRHAKSGIVHKCVEGSETAVCKIKMTSNFRKLGREFHFKYPKCLRCFPKDHNRIRDIGQLTESIDLAIKRSRSSDQ